MVTCVLEHKRNLHPKKVRICSKRPTTYQLGLFTNRQTSARRTYLKKRRTARKTQRNGHYLTSEMMKQRQIDRRSQTFLANCDWEGLGPWLTLFKDKTRDQIGSGFFLLFSFFFISFVRRYSRRYH